MKKIPILQTTGSTPRGLTNPNCAISLGSVGGIGMITQVIPLFEYWRWYTTFSQDLYLYDSTQLGHVGGMKQATVKGAIPGPGARENFEIWMHSTLKPHPVNFRDRLRFSNFISAKLFGLPFFFIIIIIIIYYWNLLPPPPFFKFFFTTKTCLVPLTFGQPKTFLAPYILLSPHKVFLNTP